MPRFLHLLCWLPLVAAFSACAIALEPGPFFEPEQPFFQTQVEIAPPTQPGGSDGNFVVRGLVIPLRSGHVVIFDQELLRVAAITEWPKDEPPVTLQTMAQISYSVARRKATGDHPKPTGRVHLATPMLPGAGQSLDELEADPRPQSRAGDAGRGPLPVARARFEGVALGDAGAVVEYTLGRTRVRESYDGAGGDAANVRRQLQIAAHAAPLYFAIGYAEVEWEILTRRQARAAREDGEPLVVRSGSESVTLQVRRGELIAEVAPSPDRAQRVTIDMTIGREMAGAPRDADIAVRPVPSRGGASERRWPQRVSAPIELGVLSENGLLLDRAAVPDDNPWRRRVRVADLAFLSADRAAVVTYDGDVWLVEGFAVAEAGSLEWQRFASGLHEPLATAAPGGIVQVATKNGLVRLHDRDGNGEADWFENFNDQLVQSQTTRSFALDMALAPDGATFVTQGGIVTQSGIDSGGTGTQHAGAIVRIAPDGRSFETFATGAREPFVTVHPRTGLVTGTDQQGHYIPSSVCYLIRRGDSFGFPEAEPARLTPPLVWIPHDQDSASSSQVWMLGAELGVWDGRLLHLSYGTGRLFLISPDLDAPVPQAAVIPLGLQTDLPLLHARMHPDGGAVWLAGFQIYGSRTATSWALGRLRAGPTPVVTPIAARSIREGVILEFAQPLDPASLRPEHVNARAWNYRRSSEYGSGRYRLDGEPGTTALGVGRIVATPDGRSVFIHLPGLPPAMQLEVRLRFRLATGEEAGGFTYFTIHQPAPVDLGAAGFGEVDLARSVPVIAPQPDEEPSVAQGAALVHSLGCLACHSTDGSGGRIGPTWRGLYGSQRTFADGSVDWADEFYLREKILNPRKRRLSQDQVEMPSYRGVVTDSQLESLVLYLKTLR